MDSEKTIAKMAGLFSALAVPTRIRILSVLIDQDMCVRLLAESLSMTQSAVSHQLRILRDNKIVKAEKIGRKALYSLNDDHVRDFIQIARDHVRHGSQ